MSGKNSQAVDVSRNTVTPVQSISIVSGKGGDGKSSLAINLAALLGEAGYSTLLMDAQLAAGTLATQLNVQPRFNLSHVLSGERTISEIVTDTRAGFQLIPAASGIPELARLSQNEHVALVKAFNLMHGAADVLIVDNDTGISGTVIDFSSAAREIMVILCDEPASINGAFETIKVLDNRCRNSRFRIVVNKVESSQHGLDVYSKLIRMTDRYLDVLLEYCGSVPLDNVLHESNCRQRVVTRTHPRAKSSNAFRKLATRVGRWPWPLEPNGREEFFSDRFKR